MWGSQESEGGTGKNDREGTEGGIHHGVTETQSQAEIMATVGGSWLVFE